MDRRILRLRNVPGHKNPMERIKDPPDINGLLRIAVGCALVGLLCVSLFLWYGFTPWRMGCGILLGLPLLIIAMALYVIAVARDLQRHGLF